QPVAGNPILEELGYPAITLPVYPLATTVAEKLHAYTMPRLTSNMRVSDLVDLTLVMDAYDLDAQALGSACAATFETPATHTWPPSVERPPVSWASPYQRLREETAIRATTAEAAHSELIAFLAPVLRGVSARWDPASRSWHVDR